jgi:hypothetical protein
MMADRVMRGSRLGSVSYKTDRNHGLAPRQIARYRTANGEEFEVPFADDAEIPFLGVLASSTLRDLVIGSGLEFEERGPYELKGVPGEWRIFAVVKK